MGDAREVLAWGRIYGGFDRVEGSSTYRAQTRIMSFPLCASSSDIISQICQHQTEKIREYTPLTSSSHSRILWSGACRRNITAPTYAASLEHAMRIFRIENLGSLTCRSWNMAVVVGGYDCHFKRPHPTSP